MTARSSASSATSFSVSVGDVGVEAFGVFMGPRLLSTSV